MKFRGRAGAAPGQLNSIDLKALRLLTIRSLMTAGSSNNEIFDGWVRFCL